MTKIFIPPHSLQQLQEYVQNDEELPYIQVVRDEYIRQRVETERRIKENLKMSGLSLDPLVNFANGVTCTIISTDNPPSARSMDWFVEESDNKANEHQTVKLRNE